jgi:hypothetical protein
MTPIGAPPDRSRDEWTAQPRAGGRPTTLLAASSRGRGLRGQPRAINRPGPPHPRLREPARHRGRPYPFAPCVVPEPQAGAKRTLQDRATLHSRTSGPPARRHFSPLGRLVQVPLNVRTRPTVQRPPGALRTTAFVLPAGRVAQSPWRRLDRPATSPDAIVLARLRSPEHTMRTRRTTEAWVRRQDSGLNREPSPGLAAIGLFSA